MMHKNSSHHLRFFLIFVLTLLNNLCQARDVQFLEDDNHDFDLLIFTQQWPVTTCLEWMERSKHHSCVLPSPKEIWTIHGVWPTRFGSIGPAFCDKSAIFDIDQLKPFMDQLEQFWINIEKGESLWSHEWLKHGTCASVLPEMSNENKYFGQGLSWLQQYSMSSILQKSGILPDQNPTVIEIHKAVINAINHNPAIHCVRDRDSDNMYLSEIRICFNKTLSLVDCDGVVSSEQIAIDYPNGKIITNCDLLQPILYPSVVPPTKILEHQNFNNGGGYGSDDNGNGGSGDGKNNDNGNDNGWKFPFVNFYKLLELIKWITL